jgi:hypothetical protein
MHGHRVEAGRFGEEFYWVCVLYFTRLYMGWDLKSGRLEEWMLGISQLLLRKADAVWLRL